MDLVAVESRSRINSIKQENQDDKMQEQNQERQKDLIQLYDFSTASHCTCSLSWISLSLLT